MTNISPQYEKKLTILTMSTSILAVLAILITGGLIYVMKHPGEATDQKEVIVESDVASNPILDDRVENGIDVATGFIAQGDYKLVKTSCTPCHSSKLVLQNRATREGWEQMIRWMQETQKLWDLGESEDKILDYLATHYAPENKGRRNNLIVEEWYEIE